MARSCWIRAPSPFRHTSPITAPCPCNLFGDITPKTELGRFVASVMMLLGWGTLAVPTGIVTAEMTSQRLSATPVPTTRTCHECLTEGHLPEALHCMHCGARLPQWQHEPRR